VLGFKIAWRLVGKVHSNGITSDMEPGSLSLQIGDKDSLGNEVSRILSRNSVKGYVVRPGDRRSQEKRMLDENSNTATESGAEGITNTAAALKYLENGVHQILTPQKTNENGLKNGGSQWVSNPSAPQSNARRV
jgi:hypothetical protein